MDLERTKDGSQKARGDVDLSDDAPRCGVGHGMKRPAGTLGEIGDRDGHMQSDIA